MGGCVSNIDNKPVKYEIIDYIGGFDNGYCDGYRSFAKIRAPHGIKFNNKTNEIYFVDAENHCVNKINKYGYSSKLTGLRKDFSRIDYPDMDNLYICPSPGHNDGDGKYAKFKVPQDLDIDSNGNLYIADTYNNCIRKVNKDGYTRTIGGSPTNVGGYADGVCNLSRFNSPRGIVVDKYDNVYVADTNNNTIRKIDKDYNTTTFYNTLFDSHRKFYYPKNITIDNDDNLVITTIWHNSPIKININTKNIIIEDKLPYINRAANYTYDIFGNMLILTSDLCFFKYKNGKRIIIDNLENPRNATIDNNGDIYVTDGHKIKVIIGLASGIDQIKNTINKTFMLLNKYNNLFMPKELINIFFDFLY